MSMVLCETVITDDLVHTAIVAAVAIVGAASIVIHNRVTVKNLKENVRITIDDRDKKAMQDKLDQAKICEQRREDIHSIYTRLGNLEGSMKYIEGYIRGQIDAEEGKNKFSPSGTNRRSTA